MSENLPIVLIEGLLVLGGALLFGWWQLRSIRRDQQKAAAERAARQAASPSESPVVEPPRDERGK
jgi:hypothetical protein